jgi:RimJ/RimL family protein N-acetyltransferase
MTVSSMFHRPARPHVVAPLTTGWAHLRPLRRGEKEPLLAVFDGLSQVSRAHRYLTGMAHLPAAMLAQLVDIDGCAHVAWVATVDGEPAGIGRYVRIDPGTVEVAFEVADAHQGRGLGTVLLDAVTTVAAANGVRRVRATVLPKNDASRRLVAHAGVTLTRNYGVLDGEADLRLLDPPPVDRDEVLALTKQHHRAAGRTPCPEAQLSTPEPA